MSNQTNSDLLREVLVELNELLTHHEEPPPKMRDEIAYRSAIRTHFLGLYVRYVALINKLDVVYDGMLQPQKREDLLVVYEAVLNRILHLSLDMRKIYGEYLDLDKILIDLKKIMDDAILRSPRYFKEEIEDKIKQRTVKMNILLERHGIPDQSNEAIFELEDHGPSLSAKDAVLIIQRCFRGFQARKRSEKVRLLKRQEMSYRASIENKAEQPLDFRRAAITVQRVWRGYITRKKVEEKAQNEMVFLGMKQGSDTEHRARRQRIKEIRKKRKAIQKQNRRELYEARQVMRKKIMEEEGPQIMQDMRDQIIEKYILLRQIQEGKDIYFPSEKEGGSRLFMTENKDVISKEADIEKKRKKEERDKLKKQSRSNFGGKGKGGGMGRGGKDQNTVERKKMDLDQPESKLAIVNAMEKFITKWGHFAPSGMHINPKQSFNASNVMSMGMKTTTSNSSFLQPLDFNEPFDTEILRRELMEGDVDKNGLFVEGGRLGIEEEIRIKQVDPAIRQELVNMNYVARKKPRRGKKKRKKKGKKKKRPMGDIDAEQKRQEKLKEIDILLSQLVKVQIAQKYISFRMEDYLYTHSYIGSLRTEHAETWVESSMAQIRQQVAELIVGMGSPSLHRASPLVRATLLYGPKDSGKTMLAKVIATELGAMWFDITNLPSHFDLKMVADAVDMVFEVALNHPPSIIYIDQAELMYRKLKRGSSDEERRLQKKRIAMKKALKRLIPRKIKPGTRVMVIANSAHPWEGGTGMGTDLHIDRFVMTVLPDFAGRKLLFEKLIFEKLGERYGTRASLLDRFEFHTLSQITEGYPAGAIARIVEKVMTKRRIKRLPLRELTIDEFIGPLSKISPVFPAENEKFMKYVLGLKIENRKKTREDEKAEEAKIKEERQKMKEERKKNRRRNF